MPPFRRPEGDPDDPGVRRRQKVWVACAVVTALAALLKAVDYIVDLVNRS